MELFCFGTGRLSGGGCGYGCEHPSFLPSAKKERYEESPSSSWHRPGSHVPPGAGDMCGAAGAGRAQRPRAAALLRGERRRHRLLLGKPQSAGTRRRSNLKKDINYYPVRPVKKKKKVQTKTIQKNHPFILKNVREIKADPVYFFNQGERVFWSLTSTPPPPGRLLQTMSVQKNPSTKMGKRCWALTGKFSK